MARPVEINITEGQIFGHLTVLRQSQSPSSHRYFLCRCGCGREASIRAQHLVSTVKPRRYCSNRCGLLSDARIEDLGGKRFGQWTVGQLVRIGEDGMSRWTCRCDCGAGDEVPGPYLVAARTFGCRECATERRRKHKTPEALLAARREASRKCARNRPAKRKAAKIKYEAKRAEATPPWLSQADWDAMDAMYKEARRLTRETGIKHQVDHIHPLQGEIVCGLHVPWNLQILTQAENVAKSNRYAELCGDVEK